MSLLGDDGLRREIVENAHRDLIASGRYSYASLVGKLDEDLVAAGVTPDALRRSAPAWTPRSGRVG